MSTGFFNGVRAAVKQNQDEAVEAAGSIRAKRQMANEAGVALGGAEPEAPSPVKPVGGSPVDRVNPLPAKPARRIDPKKIDDWRKPLGSYKKGGKVKKTGVYKLHAKERVLNAKQTKAVEGLAKGLSK